MKRTVFERPLLFGHRGSSFDHRENTISSFKACLELGIDGIELDVQKCATGEVVVIHDFDLKRVAGLDKRVDELTAQQLRTIELGDGQYIPLLDEVFSLCTRTLLYDIELKAEGVKDLGLESATYELIRKHGLTDRVMISSFNPFSLRRFKKICRNTIPTALIYSDTPSVPKLLRHGQGRFLCRPTYLKPEAKQAQKALGWNYQVCAWTVDEPSEAKELLSLGVTGIISNNPAALRNLFSV